MLDLLVPHKLSGSSDRDTIAMSKVVFVGDVLGNGQQKPILGKMAVIEHWEKPKCGLVPTKKPPKLYQKTSRFVPGTYQKNPKMYHKKPSFVPKNPPIDVAGIDPHKSYMHHQKHPFYLVAEPCGSHASTWLQTHTPIPPYTLLLHPIVESCPSPTPSQPCVHVHPLKHASQTSRPQTAIHPSTSHQKSTFPCNTHSKSYVKQNTECTLIFSSMTFHSLSYLHA